MKWHRRVRHCSNLPMPSRANRTSREYVGRAAEICLSGRRPDNKCVGRSPPSCDDAPLPKRRTFVRIRVRRVRRQADHPTARGRPARPRPSEVRERDAAPGTHGAGHVRRGPGTVGAAVAAVVGDRSGRGGGPRHPRAAPRTVRQRARRDRHRPRRRPRHPADLHARRSCGHRHRPPQPEPRPGRAEGMGARHRQPGERRVPKHAPGAHDLVRNSHPGQEIATDQGLATSSPSRMASHGRRPLLPGCGRVRSPSRSACAGTRPAGTW